MKIESGNQDELTNLREKATEPMLCGMKLLRDTPALESIHLPDRVPVTDNFGPVVGEATNLRRKDGYIVGDVTLTEEMLKNIKSGTIIMSKPENV
jgi:hypothetical protein